MKLAINGFGRIGRAVFKLALAGGIDIVAVNDIHGIKDAAYLLKYDTVYGRYDGRIEIKKNDLIVKDKRVKVFSEREPLSLPWKKLGADIVVESTGIFRDRKSALKHIEAGAKYVLITAPCSEGPDFTIVPGVNHKELKREHHIISVASCTTNCLVPVVKVLEDNFRIKKALMTTIHAYTNDQEVQDSSHKKVRRGRAAAVNIIPTTTGAAECVVGIIPKLLGKITGLAVRVPVICGSLVDLVAELEKKVDVKSINDAYKKVSKNEMKGILEYSEEELVSSDVIGNCHSAVVDGLSTQANGNLVKVLAWYDNEWGYSCRVVDVIRLIKKWV